MSEVEDASLVWRCQEEVSRLMEKVKAFEAEMAEAKERLKAKTGSRQAGKIAVPWP